MNIVINTKLFDTFQNLTVAHIFNMLLYSQTKTYQQTYIANHLGITRMTVARVLKWLKTEGYITYTRSKYKEVITTKFTLTEKALKLKKEIEKEDSTQTPPTIQNNNKEKEQENKENRQTTHKEREQGDAPKAIPNCSNANPKQNTTITSIDDIVAARREYEDKLKEKFTIQNGANT